MNSCISKTWGGEKEIKRQKKGIISFSFPKPNSKCHVGIMAPVWFVDCPADLGHLWSAEQLHTPHEKLGGCCNVPLETCHPLGPRSPGPHSAASTHFVTSLLISFGTAEAFPVGLQSHHRFTHCRRRNLNMKTSQLNQSTTTSPIRTC